MNIVDLHRLTLPGGLATNKANLQLRPAVVFEQREEHGVDSDFCCSSIWKLDYPVRTVLAVYGPAPGTGKLVADLLYKMADVK